MKAPASKVSIRVTPICFGRRKAQGAVTGYVHPWSGDGDPIEGRLGVGKGFPVDLALGVVDAYEWSNASRGQLQVWHRALNNDLRVTPTGGEDSISNLHISKPVGSFRTYAYLGSEFTVPKWLTTLRKGATFFTSGPLLEFEIDGKKPGEAIQLEGQGGRVKVNARVWSIVPLSRVVIYRNGQPFRTLSIDNRVWTGEPEHLGKPCAEFKAEIDVSDSAWYALYAEGPYSDLLDVSMPQAGTNAIRVYVGDQKIRSPESAQYFVRWIDQLKAMAEKWPSWRSQKERQHVFSQFEEARRVYQSLATEKR
jgi:hypothetical protein